MREIKFRAWNRLKKKMEPVYTLHWGSDRSRGTWNNDTWGGESDHIILMQYTGLKDKNGVEIYEGDLVTLTKKDEPYVTQGNGYLDVDVEKGWSVKGVVRFMYCCWFIAEGDKKGCPLDFEGEQALEVIGNIHDNKELLEG